MTNDINFKNSIADPPARDVGNIATQSKTASKTIKLGMFTTNENAVWGASNQLRKESYPFANISLTVNRDMFRLQVGDVFKFSYSKYSITDMICRVLKIEEESLNSENIIITAMEDVFSVTNTITTYTDPDNNYTDPTDYTAVPIVHQNVIEAPYNISGYTLSVIPIVARSSELQIGYVLYMSSDGGTSYFSLGYFNYFCAYGSIVNEYTSDTYTIDDDVGITVDFDNDDIDLFESLTRQELLGTKNTVLVGDELMTVQTITPVSGGDGRRYELSGIYRGRFDTEKETHAAESGLYLMNGNNILTSSHSDILDGTDRKFKVVPVNLKVSGSISDSLVTDLTISSRSRTPLSISNLWANDKKTNPTYTGDIELLWSTREIGTGAGVYAPSSTDKSPTWDGHFEIYVYVSSVLVRTVNPVGDFTWTYTEAMNLSDNTTLASEVTFKLKNVIDDEVWGPEEVETEITVEKE